MSLDAVPPKAAADDVLGRFREIVSDPNNQRIPRVPWAGVIGRDPRFEDPFVVMHNGLRVLMGGYYGAFSQILVINRGVHEPQEELAFSRVLNRIAAGECMVELGAYWGFYSAWFKSRHPENRVFLIEPEPLHLEAGRRNFELNGLEGEFVRGHVGPDGVDLASFMTERAIERLGILHADIPGAEAFLLDSISPILAAGRIRFLFVSTTRRSCIGPAKPCLLRTATESSLPRMSTARRSASTACSSPQPPARTSSRSISAAAPTATRSIA